MFLCVFWNWKRVFMSKIVVIFILIKSHTLSVRYLAINDHICLKLTTEVSDNFYIGRSTQFNRSFKVHKNCTCQKKTDFVELLIKEHQLVQTNWRIDYFFTNWKRLPNDGIGTISDWMSEGNKIRTVRRTTLYRENYRKWIKFWHRKVKWKYTENMKWSKKYL